MARLPTRGVRQIVVPPRQVRSREFFNDLIPERRNDGGFYDVARYFKAFATSAKNLEIVRAGIRNRVSAAPENLAGCELNGNRKPLERALPCLLEIKAEDCIGRHYIVR